MKVYERAMNNRYDAQDLLAHLFASILSSERDCSEKDIFGCFYQAGHILEEKLGPDNLSYFDLISKNKNLMALAIAKICRSYYNSFSDIPTECTDTELVSFVDDVFDADIDSRYRIFDVCYFSAVS